MSSKSKKRSNQPRKPNQPTHGDAAQAARPKGAEHHDPFEDLIETPKGKSRFQQVFLILLLIFLLVVFTIPFALTNTFTGDEIPPFLVFEDPAGGTVEVSGIEFTQELQRFELLTGGRDFEDEQVAAMIVLDHAARAAGVEVGEDELRELLQTQAAAFGNLNTYKSWAINNVPGGISALEDWFRRQMRIDRYTGLLSRLANVSDPDAIEESWNQTHQEYAFDYVELETASLEDEARAELPGDEELQAWFDALPGWEKQAFEEPVRTAAELAYYPVGTEAPQALLERYPPEPPAEGEEAPAPAELARDYYDRVYFSRFPNVPEDGGTPDPAQRYLPFEEVAEVAELEAPIYFALLAWSQDVTERAAAGEEVDLEGEATELGLAWLAQEGGLSAPDWRDLEGLGGVRLSSSIQRTEPGELLPALVVEAGALSFGRVTDRFDAVLPPLAEVREEVEAKWVEERARELATERLAELRDGLLASAGDADEDGEDEAPAEGSEEPAATVDAEAFRAAAEAAGLSVERRDWLDRAAPPTADPEADDPAHVFLASRPNLFQLEEGQLSEALLGPARDRAFLVRSLGSREVDLSKMRFPDYERLARSSAMMSRLEFRQLLTDPAELERLYDVRYPAREAREDEAPE